MPVYLRITVNAQRTELSVNRGFDPERLNTKARRATGTREGAKTLNGYLDTLQVKVHEAHRALIEAGEMVTAEKLKNKLLGRGTARNWMLLEVFREYNHQMVALIRSGEYAPGTHTHFEATLKHTEAFLRWKYQSPDIPIDQIDYAFISDFEYYLKTSVCAHNTAMKYLGDFKKIVLLSVKRGWLSKDPFMGYKLSDREVRKEFLVDSELAAIAKKEFAFERQCLVRDIFLFSCYTGLAYADVRKLRRSEIRTVIDAGKWLFIQRQKSNTPAPVPLLPVALAILDRYGKDQADVIMNITGNLIAGQVTGEIAKQLSERFGKIMQDRTSLSINRMDTSISPSKQLDTAIRASKIATLSSGEFVGLVDDNPDQKIELKAFHAAILNDHEALKREQDSYKPILVVQEVTPAMIQRKYLQIRQEVEDLVAAERERIMAIRGWRE